MTAKDTFNFYSKLKEKYKQTVTNDSYCKDLIVSLASMFVYETEDKNFEFMLNTKLERWLRAWGKIGFAMDGDELYFGVCQFTGGKLNKYGFMDKVTITTLNGMTKSFPVDEVVVMFNNNSGLPEINTLRYADKLTAIDVSWDCAVKNCRYSQMVLVKNEKVRDNIQEAIDGIEEGKPLIISGQDLLGTDLVSASNSKGVEVFNITDVANSDKLQYLTHAHDDLMRTFFQNYGIDTNSTGKMAQQTVDEIEGSVGRSFIIPNDNYNWRKKALEEIKEKFGVEIKISWGESWGVELNKYKADTDANGQLVEEIPTEEKGVETPENDGNGGAGDVNDKEN